MPATKHDRRTKLPRRFEELVRALPPQAIVDNAHYENTTEMIDRLMANGGGGKLTPGQESYLETLVQLVQAYEAVHHAIDARKGIATLKHLLDENGMSASDLARLLGVHASMGSKILKRERALTVDHLKLLSARFKVRAEMFMD